MNKLKNIRTCNVKYRHSVIDLVCLMKEDRRLNHFDAVNRWELINFQSFKGNYCFGKCYSRTGLDLPPKYKDNRHWPSYVTLYSNTIVVDTVSCILCERVFDGDEGSSFNFNTKLNILYRDKKSNIMMANNVCYRCGNDFHNFLSRRKLFGPDGWEEKELMFIAHHIKKKADGMKKLNRANSPQLEI